MAFPFRSESLCLRDRILIAIGSSGVLGMLGCAESRMAASHAAPDAGAVAGTGATGTSGSGGMSSGSGATSGSGGKSGTGGKSGSGGTTASAMCASGQPATECMTREEMEGKARYGCGQIPKSPEPTAAQIAAAFLPNGCLAKEMACDSCCNPAVSDGVAMGDGSCCFTHCAGSCCGRPLIVDGAARVAGVTARIDWLMPSTEPFAPGDLAGALGARIADEWLADAQMEHASIASFARFTLDLLAVAAPSDLVEAAQRAALDEVVHARACFALAARYGGNAQGPAALCSDGVRAAGSLREAVLSAFVEGCIGETLAAGLAQAALERARDPEVRNALSQIAADETRHAELAFRFIAWALHEQAELADDLRAALAQALAHGPAPAQCSSIAAREDAAARVALHAAGRLCADERVLIERELLVQVVQPCTLALLGGNAQLGSPCRIAQKSVVRSATGNV